MLSLMAKDNSRRKGEDNRFLVNGIVTFTRSMRRTEEEFIYRDRAVKI